MIKNTITSESSAGKTANIHCDSSQTILKRIGSTTYVVKVHYSNEGKETIEDKLHRLIKSEVENIA